jgi:mxaJ protein
MTMNNRILYWGLALLGVLGLALPASAAAPSALERIHASGTIKLCADPANPPLSAASPEPSGYDIEIAQEIARTLDAKVEYFWFATNYARRAFRQLVEGQCDYIMGLPAHIDFDESDARMALSQPYYTTGFVPVVRADLPVERYEDLRGREVGVEMMTVADFVLFRQGTTRHLYRRQRDIFKAMAAGEIDAALMWGPFAGWYAKNNPQARLRVVGDSRPEMTFALAIGVRKADRELREAIDRGIETLRGNGRLSAILARYGVPLLTASKRQAQTQPVLMAANGALEPGATVSDLEPPLLLAMGGSSPGAIDAPPQVRKGRSLYEQACYKCHGPGAISGGTIPDLRRFKGSEAEFLATVREGRVPRGMPAWKAFLSDEEILMIRTFVKSVPVN